MMTWRWEMLESVVPWHSHDFAVWVGQIRERLNENYFFGTVMILPRALEQSVLQTTQCLGCVILW